MAIMDTLTGTMGDFVRRLREERGLSQTALAAAIGLSRSHLGQIESGKIGLPNAEIRRKLATALGVSHLDLLVAAGEIRPDELRAAGVAGAVTDDPRRTAYVEAIRRMPLDPVTVKTLDYFLLDIYRPPAPRDDLDDAAESDAQARLRG